MRNAHVRVWAVWAIRGAVHGAAGAASRYTGAIGTNRHQQPPMGARHAACWAYIADIIHFTQLIAWYKNTKNALPAH
jgi:hypothetical protein